MTVTLMTRRRRRRRRRTTMMTAQYLAKKAQVNKVVHMSMFPTRQV